MSIEYTLDIQLTELGFPDLLEPDQAPNRESGAQCGHVTSMSSANKQRRELRSASKTGASRHALTSSEESVASPQSEVACQQPDPAPSQPHGPKESKPSAQKQPTTGQVSPQSPKPNAEQGQDEPSVSTESPLDHQQQQQQQQHADDDSDDSDVSEGFEEEEVDEDDCTEEEEGLSSELDQTGNFRCSVCNLQVTSEFKLQDHMNLHTGARPYGCAECGKRFCQIYNYRAHLRTHALTHQAKLSRLQQCRICRVNFDSEVDLKRHLSSTHFESKFYECDLCKRVFTSLKDCKHHVELHSCMLTFACDICGRNFSSQKSLVHHQKKHCRRHFKCTDCLESFSGKNALLKHSFSHLGLLPYTCVRCHGHFRLARLYRRHKCEPQRIHCMACLREFVNDEEFQQHKKDTGCWGNQVQSVIKDEVRCLECGEKFDTSEDLKKHAGAHQRVLKCAECGKGFRSALLLMSHMGGHAGNSPCLCQICGLGFPHQQNYDSHLKTCGQASAPLIASKKRPTLKSSSSKTENIGVSSDLSKPVRPVSTPPAAMDKPASTLKMSFAPQSDSTSPGLVPEGVGPGSGQSDGLWKLTLNEQPPPGVKLVVFLPVCSTQVGDASLQSGVPPTLTLPALSQAALFPLPTNGPLGEKTAVAGLLNIDQELLPGLKIDSDTPLDLSKKSNVPLPSLKNEPEVLKISEMADGTERQECKNNQLESSDSKAIKAEGSAEVKTIKNDLMDVPDMNTNKRAFPSHVPDIKKEPLSPGAGSCELADLRPEKKKKMEDKDES